jgi:hypothetical protein
MVAASVPSYSIGGHKENPYIPIPPAMQRPVELGSHPQSRTASFKCIAVTLWIVALSAAHAQVRAVSSPLAVASHLPSGGDSGHQGRRVNHSQPRTGVPQKMANARI